MNSVFCWREGATKDHLDLVAFRFCSRQDRRRASWYLPGGQVLGSSREQPERGEQEEGC